MSSKVKRRGNWCMYIVAFTMELFALMKKNWLEVVFGVNRRLSTTWGKVFSRPTLRVNTRSFSWQKSNEFGV